MNSKYKSYSAAASLADLTDPPRPETTRLTITKLAYLNKRAHQRVRAGLLLVAVLLAVASSLQLSSAAGVVTNYTPGDVFIGFRQSGVPNTLAVNLGSAAQFIPNTISGGTWNGTPFNVTFGVIPPGEVGAGNPVTNLSADLSAVFGEDWATNNVDNSGLDLSWAVIGNTNQVTNNTPFNGLQRRSIFLTLARTDPDTIASPPLNFDNNNASATLNSFAQGAFGNAYKGRISTVNSTRAYAGASTDGNNWGTAIGPLGSTFNSGVLGEQPLTGPNSGPTNSFLDFFLIPNTGSTLVAGPTYLGTFYLNSNGELTYEAIPEPSTYALLAVAGVAALLVLRRRRA